MSHDLSSARVSVVLPGAIDVPARFAVPVRVRAQEGRLLDVLPANGQYHDIPATALTFLSTLPDGRLLQASATLTPGCLARITLEGDLTPTGLSPRLPPLPFEQKKTALRFLVQSSIASFERTREPSLISAVVAASDQVRLQLSSSAAGVQFMQLLTRKAFPINVAYAGETSMKLVRTDSGMAANLAPLDERIDLALMYLQAGRIDDSIATLELQGITAEGLEDTGDVATAVVVAQILLAADSEEFDGLSRRLARAHPDVADFHILVAEAAARRGEHCAALDALAQLEHVGLPLLYRSFAQALVRLRRSAARDHAEARDPVAIESLHQRLQELAQHVDPASRLLVIRSARLAYPDSTPSRLARSVALPVARRIAKYQIALDQSSIKTEETAEMNAQATVETRKVAANVSPTTAGTQERTGPSAIALGAAGAALIIWIAFAIYLLTQSGGSEIKWSRIVWVFGSVEAVAFAAAGLLFGTTVNRQRAERAEQQAGANQRDAEGGRALAAALKADEPAVVLEDAGQGPQSLGVPGTPPRATGTGAVDVAARHARLARQLFP